MMRLLVIMLLLIFCVGCTESAVYLPVQSFEQPTDAPMTVSRIEAAYITLNGVIDVVWVQTMGDDDAGWLVSAEIVVADDANTVEMAETLHQAAMAVLVSAKVDFTAVLHDSSQSIDYSRWVVDDTWIVTVLGG